MDNQKATSKQYGQSASNAFNGRKSMFVLFIAVVVFLFANDVNFMKANSPEAAAAPINVKISGTISHTEYTPGQKGKITFNRFPTTVKEFEQVREQIGGEPHGAIALQLMAFEMYRHNRKSGETCIRMNTVKNNADSPIRRLNELFGKDANYARPYQVAAYLKDATPENGYAPSKPYTIEIEVGKTPSYDKSSIFQTDVISLRVLTNGKDSGGVSVSVLKTLKPDEPSKGKYFIIFECSNIYTQVKAVSFSAPFKGLD